MNNQFNLSQLHKIFDISLRNTNKHKGKNTFSLIIGANDGVLDDTLCGYCQSFGWRMLLIEPLPEHVAKLKTNFEKLIKTGRALIAEECISDKEETVKFGYIPENIIVEKNLHFAMRGMSCIMPPSNGFSTDPVGSKIFEEYKQVVEFKTKTIDKVCEEYYLEYIDYVQCDVEGYDFKVLSKFDFKKYRPKIIKFETRNNDTQSFEQVKEFFNSNNYSTYSMNGDALAIENGHLDYLRKNKRWEEVLKLENTTQNDCVSNFDNDIDTSEYIVLQSQPQPQPAKNSKTTFVTGLWNLGRDKIGGGFNRNFESHYISQFKYLLQLDVNLIIFCDEEVEKVVWQSRNSSNTVVYRKTLQDIKNSFDFFDKVQKIRNNPDWKNQSGWLVDSPQSSLEYYNPVIMSKFFMLHDSCIFNPFNSEYFFWIDAGISSTVNLGYFTRFKVQDKLPEIAKNLLFLSFPYDGQVEVHGFTKQPFNEYCGTNSEYVARGGFFGGQIEYIKKFNSKYYHTLRETLDAGYMGTEESVFTILCYKFSEDITRINIGVGGMINTFFESIKNDNIEIEKPFKDLPSRVASLEDMKVYILTFNSPTQLRMLVDNFKNTYPELLTLKDKVIVNNSTNREFDEEYNKIAVEYNFVIQNFDNIGICGARQWVAEDFDKSDKHYYIFFEDDMQFNTNKTVCKNGFYTFHKNFLEKSLKIIEREQYDYLKITYSEFFGDNSQQWSYCNVPQSVRLVHFGDLKLQFPRDYDKLPPTTVETIKSFESLPYCTGEFYYCNWPLIFTKEGNKKVFLTTKWARPYEQTWMSYVFQEQRKKSIKTGCLLISPISHNRTQFYEASERKES